MTKPKVIVDIDQGYLYGFPCEVPSYLLDDKGEFIDYQEVRKWILEKSGREEFYSLRKWYQE